MLLAHLVAAVFFSFTLIIRAPHISTSLVRILSWTKPIPSPPPIYNSYSQPVWHPLDAGPSNCSNPPCHLLSHTPSVTMCPNRLEIITGLAPRTICPAYDEFGVVGSQVYEPFCDFVPLSGKQVKRFRLLHHVASKISSSSGWRLSLITQLYCAILCACIFVGCYRCRVSEDVQDLNPIFPTSYFYEKELSPVISKIVFGDPIHVHFNFSEENMNPPDLDFVVDSYGCVNKSEHPYPAPSPSSTATTIDTSLNIYREPHPRPTLRSSMLALADSHEAIFMSPDICNDRNPLEPSPLSTVISIVAATPNSSTPSSASSSLMSPLSSPRSLPTSSPITSTASSPTLPFSTSILYNEECAKDDFEHISIHDLSLENVPPAQESDSPIREMEVQPLIVQSNSLDLPITVIHVGQPDDVVDRRIPINVESIPCKDAKCTENLHETMPSRDATDASSTVPDSPQSSTLNDQKIIQPVPATTSGPPLSSDVSAFDSSHPLLSSDSNISWADDVDNTLFDPTCVKPVLIEGPETLLASEGDSTSSLDISRAPNSPIQYKGIYHSCCELVDHDFTPESWDAYEWSPCWTTKSRFRPKDSDSTLKSSRFAVDNIDFMKCSGVRPGIRFTYQPLEEALARFSPSKVDCFNPRLDGTAQLTAFCYGIVDFDSVEEASTAFRYFQGRRISKGETHWRLEFLNPDDETCGGRKLVEKPLQSQRRRVLNHGLGTGERRRPGSDIRGVLTATQAHNSNKKKLEVGKGAHSGYLVA